MRARAAPERSASINLKLLAAALSGGGFSLGALWRAHPSLCEGDILADCVEKVVSCRAPGLVIHFPC
jgi:hypothetical protein